VAIVVAAAAPVAAIAAAVEVAGAVVAEAHTAVEVGEVHTAVAAPALTADTNLFARHKRPALKFGRAFFFFGASHAFPTVRVVTRAQLFQPAGVI
jgi:hypothetical protein